MVGLSAPIEVAGRPLGLHVAEAAAVTPETLSAAGVTHAVNATVDAPMPPALPLAACTRVPVADDIDAPLHAHLEGAGAFIERALEGGGRVLIFCATGDSAAPAVASFFLMRHRRLRLADALGAVRAARAGARPNVGFWQRLVEAESWIHAPHPPSMTLQQYRWAFLEAQGEAAGGDPAAREEALRRLQLAQAEAEALVHRHSFTTVTK
jgi:hypothetical protein